MTEKHMTSLPQLTTRKKLLMPLIGLAAFFLYIYLFHVDVAAIFDVVKTGDPVLYAFSILVSIVEVLFFAISWRVLLQALEVKLSTIKACLFVYYGLFTDILIPGESVTGEVCRVYLVTREQNGTSGKVVASLVMHRLFGMSINVAVLLLGLGLLFSEGAYGGTAVILILICTLIIAAFLIALLVLAFNEGLGLKAVHLLMRLVKFVSRGRWNIEAIKDEAVKTTRAFHNSMHEYARKPKPLAVSLFLLLLSWFCSMSIPYIVFASLRNPVSWGLILVSNAILVAVKSIPVGVPFEVGLPEITLTTLYVGLGVPADVAATATLLSRFVTLWLRFILGFAAQQLVELHPKLAGARPSQSRGKTELLPAENAYIKA
jgi:uncharacterized protein (TIRG00374 family)